MRWKEWAHYIDQPHSTKWIDDFQQYDEEEHTGLYVQDSWIDDFQLYDEEEHTGLYVQQLMDDDEWYFLYVNKSCFCVIIWKFKYVSLVLNIQ